MTEPLALGFALSGTKRESVTAFMREAYARAYGTKPEGAQAYAFLERAGRIIACFGLDGAGDDGKFGVERIYELDRAAFPLSVTNENTRQLGRMACAEPGLGRFIAYAAFRFAREQGIKYGIADHEDWMHRVTLEYGFSFRELPYRGVRSEAIPDNDRAYFTKGTARPHLVELEESLALMRPRLPAKLLGLYPQS